MRNKLLHYLSHNTIDAGYSANAVDSGLYVSKIQEACGEGKVLVLPSDHLISESFFDTAKKAEACAERICLSDMRLALKLLDKGCLWNSGIFLFDISKMNDGKEVFLHENKSIYVPKSITHRIENPGKMKLHIIEVQTGGYLEENDIVRFETNGNKDQNRNIK